jgi:hypothetical protein
VSCVLKTTKCAKKRAENFSPVTMTVTNDPLPDLTLELSELQISSDLLEIAPEESSELFVKRSRANITADSSLLSRSGTFFDPLLYLRVKKGETPQAPNEDIGNRPVPPSLDEILKVGKERSYLLVEPIVRPLKQKNRQESNSDKMVVPASKPSPKLPVAVYRFCQEHSMRYFALGVRKTYRSIAFRRKPSNQAESSDPWEEYTDVNRIGHYRLCHAVMLQEEGNLDNKIVVITPHSGKHREINLESLKSILNSSSSLKRMSLTSLEKEFGFPTFVCPPFGHEYAPKIHNDSMSKKFSTVIDSRLVDEGTTDCFFDLGIVGIIVRPAELARLSRTLAWTVVTQDQLLVSRNYSLFSLA